MKSAGHPYLTTLTPLRGIAALLVVIFHCNLMFRQFLPNGYTKYLDNSLLWVDFFFVLSGFIMFYAYKKYFEKGVSLADFKKYMGARFARVYPLYFFTTIWAFISCVLILRYSAPLYLHALMMCGLIVALTIVTASLVYRFVEVPARNYFNRVFSTKQPKIRVERVEV